MGAKALMFVLLGLFVLFFLIDIATAHQNWFGVLVAVVQLVLLLLPVTRRFFASSNSRAAPG